MELFSHQRKAVEIARTRPRFAYWHDCGCGKTIALLAICAERPIRTLTLAPKSILRSAWARDATHFPLKVEVVTGTAAQQRRIISDSTADIFVTNYEAFKKHADLYEAIGVQRFIVDESSKLKDPDSQISKAAARFSEKMEEVYLLSGTPAPNDGTEYYGQLRCLDPRVAINFSAFAYRYFTPKKRTIWKPKRREIIEGWLPRQDRKAEFEALLSKWGWTLRKEDALDLPAQLDREIYVDLSDDELDAYRSAIAELRILGRKINAEAATMKLRQIVNGTVRLEGERTEIGSSKLEALDELLDEIGPQPVVIWCEFTADIDRVSDLCHKKGLDGAILDGRTSANAAWIADNFQRGNLKALICHPQAAGHGITLTAATHAVYYGLGWSYELHKQSRDRIHRAGQTRPCTYHYLLAADTIEEKMLEVVRGKGDAAEALRDILAVQPV